MPTIQINKKYNFLTVIEKTKNKNCYYRCLCECGNYKDIQAFQIYSGETKSCGCYSKKLHKEASDAAKTIKIGDKFNSLTALSEEYHNKRSRLVCDFICDCGEILLSKLSYAVKKNKSKSCLRCTSLYKDCHLRTDSHLYMTWSNLKCRCYTAKGEIYDLYGGKGYTVCDDWRNSYINFYNWAMKNNYKDGMVILVDHNLKIYSPETCKLVERSVISKSAKHKKS